MGEVRRQVWLSLSRGTGRDDDCGFHGVQLLICIHSLNDYIPPRFCTSNQDISKS